MLAMFSYLPPDSHNRCDIENFTTASTFLKAKSLKLEVLFGDDVKKLARSDAGADIRNAVDYYFPPGAIFGFAYESFGVDYERFHHAFVLRACAPGQKGHVVMGITPGACVLVRTLTSAATSRLRSILEKLKANGVEPSQIGDNHYCRLNRLLDVKMNTDYFVGELIAEKNSF